MRAQGRAQPPASILNRQTGRHGLIKRRYTMKRIGLVTIAAIAGILLIGATAFAGCCGGYGQGFNYQSGYSTGYGPGSCCSFGAATVSGPTRNGLPSCCRQGGPVCIPGSGPSGSAWSRVWQGSDNRFSPCARLPAAGEKGLCRTTGSHRLFKHTVESLSERGASVRRIPEGRSRGQFFFASLLPGSSTVSSEALVTVSSA